MIRSPGARLQVWTALTTLMLLAMESNLEAMWYRAVFNTPLPWVQVWAVLMSVMTGSGLLVLGLAHPRFKSWARPVIFLPWLVGCIAISMKVLLFPQDSIALIDTLKNSLAFITDLHASPAGFFHILVMGLLAWRAVSLASSPPASGQTLASFQLGLIGFLIYGMGFAFRSPLDSTIGFSLFLWTGLVAMSMTRIANLDDFLLEHTARVMPRYGSGWLSFTLLASLLVVGLALLLGWLASGALVMLAVRLVTLILTLITALFLILLIPLILFLWQFIPSFGDILKQAFARLMSIQLPPFVEDLLNRVVYLIQQSVPYLLEGRKLLLVGILLLLALVILLGLRQTIKLRLNEGNSPIGEAGAGLEHLLERLLRLRSSTKAHPRRSPAQVLAAARIRMIYRRLMILSRKLGSQRRPAQTPLEFLPQLETLFPTEKAGVNAITQAYIKVRYGEYPETFEEVKTIESAWERIRRAGVQK